MASIRKLNRKDPESPWVVEYTDTSGKRRRETPKSGLKKDAEKIRQRIESELADGTHLASSASVTFGKAGDLWIKDIERRWRIKDGMTGETYKKYECYLRLHVRPAFGSILLKDMTARRLQTFLNDMRQRHAATSVANLANVTKLVMKFAVDQGWLKHNPVGPGTTRVPANNPIERAIPSKDEIRLILEAVAERKHGRSVNAYRNRLTMVILALFTGMRRGEIFALTWENIDLDQGIIHVRTSASMADGIKAPKSKAGVRNIPMSRPVRSTIEWAKSDAKAMRSEYVISNAWGQRMIPTSCYDLWQSVMKDAGLSLPDGKPKYSFHSLRHAAASLLIEQGLDAFVLKTIIGHAKVSITMDIYGHLFNGDQRGSTALNAAADQFTVATLPALTHQTRHKRDAFLQPIDK